jgi:chemotaxis signal transduction protein
MVFDNAHKENLELLSDEAFWEYAQELAQERIQKRPEIEPSQEYLECRLRSGYNELQRYRISLQFLNEVVWPPHIIVLLPSSPRWMPGVVAWRGETIAVVDLAAYLAHENTTVGLEDDGVLLVASMATPPIGLLVTSIGTGSWNTQSTSILAPDEETVKDAAFLDIPLILSDMLRQIETYG